MRRGVRLLSLLRPATARLVSAFPTQTPVQRPVSLIARRAFSAEVKVSIDVTEQTFTAEVLQASAKVPVLVDCHATWCQPCKILAPILEKEVAALNGAVKLVKIDTDKNPNLAQALQVSSLPTVLAVYKGKAINSFVGALPQAEVAKFVQAVVAAARGAAAAAGPSPVNTPEAALEQAHKFAAGQSWQRAEEVYTAIVQHDEWGQKFGGEAKAGLAWVWANTNRKTEAQELVANIKESHKDVLTKPFVIQSLASIELVSAPTQDEQTLREILAANPNDHGSRLELAKVLFSKNKAADAINEVMLSVQKDVTWNEGAARKTLVQIFEALGESSPLVVAGRRRLTNYLFR